MTYTHLFWDFDGTLYNSYPQIVRAMRRALESFGATPPREGALLCQLKKSVSECLALQAERLSVDVEALHERFHAYHLQEGFFPPYEGLANCLSGLAQSGARHYLYTHRDNRAWENLRRDGLARLFTDGVTSEDGFPMKPAPDALQSLTRKHGLNPAHCLMIGDRDIDVQSGRNAGMAGLLFDPDGFYPMVKTELRANSLAELRQRVERA